MIHEVIFNNLKKSNFKFVSANKLKKMKILSKAQNIVFNKGLNVIIGENGSGKSTLINILSEYTCCKSGETKYTLGLNDECTIYKLSGGLNNSFLNGINVKNNYNIKVNKLIFDKERSKENIIDNIGNFSSYLNSITLSDGEKLLFALNNTFERMFTTSQIPDKSDLNRKNINGVWMKYRDNFVNYMNENNIIEDEPIYSLIMDEPDRNLDISNINQLKNIFLNQKENGQMIITLHNPLLIYALSKDANTNFIELTNGYKDKIINEVNLLLK